MFIDLLRQWRPALRDVARQRPAQERGKPDNRGVAEQVLQERLHRLEAIRAAEIEQHDGQSHVPLLTRATNCATCASGVSGRIPWPRLKMKGVPWVALKIPSTARSKASPPAINTMGSRLPCTTVRDPRAFAAHRIDAAVSTLIAFTPVSAA